MYGKCENTVIAKSIKTHTFIHTPQTREKKLKIQDADTHLPVLFFEIYSIFRDCEHVERIACILSTAWTIRIFIIIFNQNMG